MLIGCTYLMTVVTTYITQRQLDIKLRNQLYRDKYIVKDKKKSGKEIIGNILKFTLPGYNITKSLFDLYHFDNFYVKELSRLVKNESLEKMVVDDISKEEKEELLDIPKTKVDKVKDKVVEKFSISDKIRELKQEKESLLNSEKTTEFSKIMTKKNI